MMLARCPACQTVFRARPEQLRAHAGKVRCGHCYLPFNALDHLIDVAEPTKPATPEVSPSPERETLFILEEGRQDIASRPEFELPSGPKATPPRPDPSSAQPADMILSLDHELDFALPAPVTSSSRKPPAPLTETLDEGGSPEGAPSSSSTTRREPGQDRLSPGLKAAPLHGARSESPETVDAHELPEDTTITAPEGDRLTSAHSGGDKTGLSWVARAAEDDVQGGIKKGAESYQPPIRRHPRNASAERRATTHTGAETDDTADFTHYQRTRTSAKRHGFSSVLAGILIGTLVVQSLFLFRLEITRTWPQLRPLYLSVCQKMGCSLPLPQVATAIRITRSDLESDPANPSHLVLNASLRNQALHPQAHPHLEITLTDARDRPIVRRVFLPQEWTDAARLDQGLAAGEETTIQLPLAVVDVSDATGYRLYAFYP